MATILITDDRAASRRYLATLLERTGHRVIEAGDGASALRLVRDACPELVLIDILLPAPGGYEFVRHLRRDRALTLPRMLLLAAPYMEHEARLLAQACGISHVATDVENAEALLAAVAAALAEPPLRHDEAQPADTDGNPLYPMASRLYERVAELEKISAWLERRAATTAAQLETARSALDREVLKRLRIEHAMTMEFMRTRGRTPRDP